MAERQDALAIAHVYVRAPQCFETRSQAVPLAKRSATYDLVSQDPIYEELAPVVRGHQGPRPKVSPRFLPPPGKTQTAAGKPADSRHITDVTEVAQPYIRACAHRPRKNYKLWGLSKEAYKHLAVTDAVVVVRVKEDGAMKSQSELLTHLSECNSDIGRKVRKLQGTIFTTKLGMIKRLAIKNLTIYHNTDAGEKSKLLKTARQQWLEIKQAWDEGWQALCDNPGLLRDWESLRAMVDDPEDHPVFTPIEWLKEDLRKLKKSLTLPKDSPIETPELPASLLHTDFDDGDNVWNRKIDNANSGHVGGEFDREVQELPLFVNNVAYKSIGRRFRPTVEKLKDKVPFGKYLFGNYYDFEGMHVDADLLGELKLEAAFQVRSHALLLHLKQRARRHLQRFDMRCHTRMEIREMVVNAVTCAMIIDDTEAKAVELMWRTRKDMFSANKRYAKLDKMEN